MWFIWNETRKKCHFSTQTYNALDFLGNDIKVEDYFTADGLLVKVHIPEQVDVPGDNVFCVKIE